MNGKPMLTLHEYPLLVELSSASEAFVASLAKLQGVNFEVLLETEDLLEGIGLCIFLTFFLHALGRHLAGQVER